MRACASLPLLRRPCVQQAHTCRGRLYFCRQRLVALDESLRFLRKCFDLVLGERIEAVLIGDKERGLA